MWEGKVDVEDWRARMDRVKRGSASKTERMEGPSLPPAPMRRTLVRGKDIFLGNFSVEGESSQLEKQNYELGVCEDKFFFTVSHSTDYFRSKSEQICLLLVRRRKCVPVKDLIGPHELPKPVNTRRPPNLIIHQRGGGKVSGQDAPNAIHQGVTCKSRLIPKHSDCVGMVVWWSLKFQ